MKYRDEILRLREEGKTYNEIKEITGASKGTISYHCGEGQKEKYRKRNLLSKSKRHPYKRKVEHFISSKKPEISIKNKVLKIERLMYEKISRFTGRKTMKNITPMFTYQDVIDKFGENPKCYLTGKPIDIYQPRTYQFDHIVPVSKGGLGTLDNLGLCTKGANQSKNDMLLDDFLSLCKDILEHNGFNVTKE